ncbi:RNA-binding S4 domain-containing protein [Defluviimonas sp. WL0024]|uniref:RNA-binding S4 domain-containing protein n=2 Tax=Albidovulum TaxID=205889 RepID=A0ABT3J8Q3_9RHOB|nr:MULTISPECIES: RNA-binding S4 domain-containing protein [Defluviimonas]MCU9849817.1 RNA-binding S4 domain-containing protein [Defluviimonas sp. WL0024]MCW3784062.1 RNA-binding S4 domain-containing protein [Defluviimonas salinarum]
MAAEGRIRVDKWLWQARFFKTRSLAAATVSSGHLRLNGAKTAKPGHAVGPGDVLTFPQGGRIRVVCIRACGTRRGPAPEAQALYDDLAPDPAEPRDTVLPEAPPEE